MLKAKKAGRAAITVASKLQPKIKAKCRITVKKAPTKITLKQSNRTLKIGESFKLEVQSVEPKNAYSIFKYKISNADVAAVDTKGFVTAKKAGTAVVSLVSPARKKVSATCIITVEEDKKISEEPGTT